MDIFEFAEKHGITFIDDIDELQRLMEDGEEIEQDQ